MRATTESTAQAEERLRSTALRLKSEIAAERVSAAAERLRVLLRKYGFDPNQPRVADGNGIESGRWIKISDSGVASRASSLTQLAGDITGFTKHGGVRAIERGVGPEAIYDAVANPIEIVPQPGGRMKYVGRSAVVVLNAAGLVITVWGQ